ncbi:MAG: aldose 1-epimerase family protein [Novosphingobium sp.]
MEFVTISSGDLTARINPFGAELWSLTDAQGREFMTDGDPAFWPGHAPLLFPVVGGLHANRYRLDGQEYELPRHGFARRSTFETVEAAEGRARFRLRDSAETRAVYPFAFALEMTFVLDGTTLHMAATVRNSGDAALPFSFGYHPAFAWPLPGGADKADHVIAFASPEPQPVRRVDPQTHRIVAPRPFAHREIKPSVEQRRIDEALKEVTDRPGDIPRRQGTIADDRARVALFPIVQQLLQQVFAVLEIPVKTGPRNLQSLAQAQDFDQCHALVDQHVA